MSDRKFKACLFVDEVCGTASEGQVLKRHAYDHMIDWLTFYLADFEFALDIRPYQLKYRHFDVYLIDIGGYPEEVQERFVENLGSVIKSRPSRLYLFWTGETWEAFYKRFPDYMEKYNCINCCDLEAIEKSEKILLDME